MCPRVHLLRFFVGAQFSFAEFRIRSLALIWARFFFVGARLDAWTTLAAALLKRISLLACFLLRLLACLFI
jgi:hypothetical protein